MPEYVVNADIFFETDEDVTLEQALSGISSALRGSNVWFVTAAEFEDPEEV